MNGALLVNKHQGISSFGVIEELQKSLRQRTGLKRKDLPKMGHGGTLDPFATGLLIVCVGKAVKLARYFLGGTKRYDGKIIFGQTTIPGDPTDPISETSDNLPENIDILRDSAKKLTLEPYLQKPPMHSAKKKDGKPLYELARAGIEVEREAKLCSLYKFDILSYEKPKAEFDLTCSSGTYVRTLSQDLGKQLNTVAMLETLNRSGSGTFSLKQAWTVEQIRNTAENWDNLPCWVPFDHMLNGYDNVAATDEEASDIINGRQGVLFNLVKRATFEQKNSHLVIFYKQKILAVARNQEHKWELERVFPPT